MEFSRRSLLVVPPAAFAFAYLGLSGESLEQLDAPPLEGARDASGAPVVGVRHADLGGAVTLVHAIASWCPYCEKESAFARELAGDPRFRFAGLFVRDKTANAQAYIERHGNPYDVLGFDADGRAERQLGVRGVPNTFILAPQGQIVHTLRGPMTRAYFEERMLPIIEAFAPAMFLQASGPQESV